MAIKNSVPNDFLSYTFIVSINIFDCRLSGVNIWVNNILLLSSNSYVIKLQREILSTFSVKLISNLIFKNFSIAQEW